MSLIGYIVGLIRKAFATPKVEPPAEKPEPKFTVEHPWPFASDRPEDEDFFIRQLCEGVEVVGDHVFLKINGHPVRHMRNKNGKKTHKARHIVWWMEGKELPKGVSGLRTTCGQEKCIKISHLEPATVVHEVKDVVERKPQTKAKDQKVQGYVVKNGKKTEVPKFTPEDRLKCSSRKVFFDTEQKARECVNILNRPEIRGNGRKQFAYPCDLGCGGWHLTKIDPKKYEKKVKKRKKAMVW